MSGYGYWCIKRGLSVVGGVLLLIAATSVNAQEHPAYCLCCSHLNPSTEGGEWEVEPFQVDDRWLFTATDGATGDRGDPVTLTYGLVPDGTIIRGSEGRSGSDLISFLQTNIGNSSVYLPLFHDAYGRWAEISGVTMVYEPNDDGNANGGIDSTSNPRGELGVRADMRIGGHSIDGQSGPNTLAYNYFPDHGDQVIDTDNTSFYSLTSSNYRALRNVLMHEAGHGLGLSHFTSGNSNGLMEPSINLGFDGPQFDDILAVQRNYGDALEKSGGNDTLLTATGLGTFAGTLETFSIGTDASDTTAVVGGTATDFVSIDGTSDTDVFAFTLSGSVSYAFDLVLAPKGPTYNEGPQGGTETTLNTKALTNLELELLDSAGVVVASADVNGAGLNEFINTVLSPGDYYARVSTGSGAVDTVQMYQFDVSMLLLAGDADGDGDVDAFDITAVEQNFGSTASGSAFLLGDADGDGDVDAFDITAVEQHFGNVATSPPSLELVVIPEPSTFLVFSSGFFLLGRRKREAV